MYSPNTLILLIKVSIIIETVITRIGCIKLLYCSPLFDMFILAIMQKTYRSRRSQF